MSETCRRCGSEMRPGLAMGQTAKGAPDFPGDRHASTMSAGGPGKLMQCMKCPICGWSVTRGTPLRGGVAVMGRESVNRRK